jgi:hypothetical protein
MTKKKGNWTDQEVQILTVLIEEAMAYEGWVDFKKLTKHLNRTAVACISKADALELEYTKDENHKPKVEKELFHKDGTRVNYA